MKNAKNDLPCMSPVKNYKSPQLPTLGDVRDNPTLLKKLPSRWKKNTAVIACIGFMGAITLTGCVDDNQPHHGGVVSPIYVAYATEEETRARLAAAQDAFNIVRAQMDVTELNLRTHHGGSGAGPFYVVHFNGARSIGLHSCKVGGGRA